jgi:hypothetical protein
MFLSLLPYTSLFNAQNTDTDFPFLSKFGILFLPAPLFQFPIIHHIILPFLLFRISVAYVIRLYYGGRQ